MNIAFDLKNFGFATVIFLTVGALVAQWTIRLLSGFKPRYLDTFAAGLLGNGAAYLLGLLCNRIFMQLRLNFTIPLLCLVVAGQIVVQAIAYMLLTRVQEGRRIRFWHGFVATIVVFAFGALVLLGWSQLHKA